MKKNRFDQDPFAEREAQKYESPVPSREFILKVLGDAGQLWSQQQLAEHFKLHSEDELEGLRRRLRAMERDGQLIRNRKGGYGIVKKMDLIRGRVIGHPDGFGFLVPDDGGDDLFITAKRMRSILHGDRVVARVMGLDHRGRREAAPVEVLERANHEVVGRFHQEHGISIIIPSNKRLSQDILIPPEKRGAATQGQIVVATIIEQPNWRSQPIAEIKKILGDHMAPGMEIDIAIRSHELPNDWPMDVKSEATIYGAEVPEQNKQNREDIRQLPLVTIDGEDSKDFDDAVYVEAHAKGYRLLVAIADVASYVKKDSALDKEAFNRGNSVYFPGRVIPMLPEVLSNGLCSLNPNVDRLCMVCEIIFNSNGTVFSYRFFEGIMRSAARLTYTEVAAVLQERIASERKRFKKLLPHLEAMYELYQILAKRREKRGAIEFETTETRIVFGEQKKIDRIVPVVRNNAHRLIEEFMIIANVAAADILQRNHFPTLYRVHTGPSDEKFEDLKAFLSEFGLTMPGKATSSPQPKHYAKLLQQVKTRPDAHLINMVLLRSLSQAVYCPDNQGHFGLAFDAYAHFTSPIRRYPDLMVHRALKHLIHKRKAKSFHYSHSDMELIGEHCSRTERRADEATRDVTDWLKCEFLQDKVGEGFNGRISAVTSFGLFVELDDLFVEGLVHITALDNDYYHFDAVNHRLVGERSRKIYRLSDPVRIKVMRVNLDDRKVDFELAERRTKDRSAKKTGRRHKANKQHKKARPRR
ncbi:MAG: ribonuclease R [Gammaproteobacteria bacterium]|nr:ribonuclease R [Gammaproteobacteria bacterium]